MAHEDFSRESFLGGRLLVHQPRRGYRFSLDAFLLAGFVRLRPGELALELGAGCGVVSLWLAVRHGARVVALELQERLARALALNVRENRLSDLWPVRGDLRRLPVRAGRFDVVLSNPPFFPPGRGRLCPDEEERLARHEVAATLEDVLSAAHRALRHRGRLYLVHPAWRLGDLLCGARRLGLEPKRLRLVHSHPGDEGRLVLLEAVKGGGAELRIMPPLFIYQRPGGPYSSEVEALFAPCGAE